MSKIGAAHVTEFEVGAFDLSQPERVAELIRSTALFDDIWYLEHNPDVALAGIDPLMHFLAFGSKERRNPNPLFDTDWYVASNPELLGLELNPLLHYIMFGAKDWRDPHPLFDTRWYLADLGIDPATVNPLSHYISQGALARRDPHPLFDTGWYVDQFSSTKSLHTSPLAHYITGGAKHFDPHPLFNVRWFLSNNPLATTMAENPLAFFVIAGSDKINPHPLFDSATYLALNPDVADLKMNALIHYIKHGAAESRPTGAVFDSTLYLSQNPDLAARQGNLLHYAKVGIFEGRDPSQFFDSAWYEWRYPEFKDSGLRGYAHYVAFGKTAGYVPTPPTGLCADLVKPLAPEPFTAPNGPEWKAAFNRRLHQRVARLELMDLSNPFDESLAFSVTTTVYDTSPVFLHELAETLRKQAFRYFEWVILDNGSSDPRTIEALRNIVSSDTRFKLHRMEQNLHIIGGNRFLLDRVVGRYVVPVDSDDILYIDSLALLAGSLRCKETLPGIVFSDEHKITENGTPFELIWRWNFTLANAMETVPCSHLMAIDASQARRVDAYAQDYAQGSHDWDTCLRIAEHGVTVKHVPEVLYGWRIHAASTSGDYGAKSYIAKSQLDVIEASLRRRNLLHLFNVSKLFEAPGWYRVSRERFSCPPCEIDFIIGNSRDDVNRTEHNLQLTLSTPGRKRVIYPAFRRGLIDKLISKHRNDLVEWISYEDTDHLLQQISLIDPGCFAKVLISSTIRVKRQDAIWEAIGTLELDPRVGIVSGPFVSSDSVVLASGYIAGPDNRISALFAGWAKSNVPGDQWLVRRRVTAAPTLFMAIRGEALRKSGSIKGLDEDDIFYGVELAKRLSQHGYTVVNLFAMEAERDTALARIAGEGSAAKMAWLRATLSDPGFAQDISPHLSRLSHRFGKLLGAEEAGPLLVLDSEAISPAVPLNLRVDDTLADRPTINLLLPAVRMISMSGGPNTALNLSYRLAELGFALRIVSTDWPVDQDLTPVWQHIRQTSGVNKRLSHVEIVSAADRSVALAIGSNDIFFATAWWTAQMAKHAAHLLGDRPFIYLIQDYEPLFYPTSTLHALALETYGLNHLPVINTGLLRDYLTTNKVGRYADVDFAAQALTFEPALSATSFYPVERYSTRARLLFYARPSHARNLFDVGVAALRSAIARGLLSPLHWDFVGMGEEFSPVDLGFGAVLECAPWLGFDAYAEQMRQSQILLSLMLSPHPSYPPLEMAACGGLVVTNSFSNKTAEHLSRLSPQIIAADPSIESVTAALGEAAARFEEGHGLQSRDRPDLPRSWDDSFAKIIPELSLRIMALGIRDDGPEQSMRAVKMPGDRRNPDVYADFLDRASATRSSFCLPVRDLGLLSFITAVWNTPPEFLEVLGRSLASQLGEIDFEWCVLDNGSTNKDTLSAIERLKQLPFVRFERSETNLGIVLGSRHCLERATGRYILPVDHDDYVFPDAARTITWYLQKHDYPAIMYSDETLLSEITHFMPYMKPDWDPVLFINSCYTSHLGVLDRKLALEYGAYTDTETEASPDWDAFTRFVVAGHTPIHVPEILYSWRTHEQSTSSNIGSKPYVAASHQRVLGRFLAGQLHKDRFDVQLSPFFKANVDWWFRRRRNNARPILSILVRDGEPSEVAPNFTLPSAFNHRIMECSAQSEWSGLIPVLRRCYEEDRLIHVISAAAQPDNDEWAWEAIGLFEMFADTVLVGGRVHAGGIVLGAGYYLGLGTGCDCHDRGQDLSSPGYFGQLLKPHSVSAVSMQHAVMLPEFLLSVIEETSCWRPSFAGLGRWAGAIAKIKERRVIFSPFISATVSRDWENQLTKEEKGRFSAAFAYLMPDAALVSPNVGLRPETSFVPQAREEFMPTTSGITLPDYPSWLQIRQSARATDAQAILDGPVFSILTTVYSQTDATLFNATSRSVIEQTYSRYEWVILAHGPITPGLDAALRRLAEDTHVRVLRLASNLGIMGGMRCVLEAAQGDYVLPLDGDDLLVTDCLEVLARTIVGNGKEAEYIYSDEDVLVGDQLRTPFMRPAWDPVLALENSWIWHLGVFRRATALQVGVYQDRGSEYCHDWDTLYRFTARGHIPIHIPEVLYHWRHHAHSTSNRENPGQGSSQSVHHLLTSKIEGRGLSAFYEVAPFPIYRGAPEWSIHRLGTVLPPLHCLVFETQSDLSRRWSFHEDFEVALPNLVVTTEAVTTGPTWHLAMLEKLATLGDTMVLLMSDLVQPSSASVLEAIKLYDFQDDLAIVSGRLIKADQVVAAGLMLDDSGTLRAPYDGRSIGDPGQFALGWKPQCITVPILDLCFAKASFLCRALHNRPQDCTLSEFGFWLASVAMRERQRVAFSPLVSGDVRGNPLRARDAYFDTICWRRFQKIATPDRRNTRPPWAVSARRARFAARPPPRPSRWGARRGRRCRGRPWPWRAGC